MSEFFEKYVPPVVPIPGGFFIDFVRAYKMITEAGEPTASERRLRRINFKRRELEHAVQELKSDL